MKMNFKYATMATALIVGFASCSKDSGSSVVEENPYLNTPTEFTIKATMITSEMPDPTRAPSETAVDIPPHVFDMALIFVGMKNATSPLTVLDVVKGDPIALTGVGQKFKGMPLGITDLYIVGNIEEYNGRPTDAVTGAPVSVTVPTNFGLLAAKAGSAYANSTAATELEKLQLYIGQTFDQLQADVKFSLDNYEITDAKAVNIYGHGEVTATQGTTSLELFVRPAISRYEIKGIGLKEGSTLTAGNIVVDGIYISNTMRQISFDGTVYGADETLLNWGWNERRWNYSLNDLSTKMAAAVPAVLQDLNNPNWSIPNYYAATNFPADNDVAFGDYASAGVWAKWMDNENALLGSLPLTLSGDQRFSYYVASARQQATKQIVNPYDENQAHNFIGLECGTWPYLDEQAISGIDRPVWATAGSAIQYGAFPTICIKVRNTNGTFTSTGTNVGWLTVTKFIKAGTTEYLKHPQEGRVYVFNQILFDDNNVKPDPMYPGDETDLSVHVMIKGWEGVDVENPF